MVQVAALLQAAATAVVLFSSTTAGELEATQPPANRLGEVNKLINSITGMTAQAKAINTTAKSISAQYSCLEFGLTGGGPLKKMIDQIQAINTNLDATGASIGMDVTTSLNTGDDTELGYSKNIYLQYQKFQTEARNAFDTIAKRSDGMDCSFLPIVLDFTAEGAETREKLIEYKASLRSFKDKLGDYDIAYYPNIFDGWIWITGKADNAIVKYDAFKPVETDPEDPEDPDKL